jgi:hypothetical protein
MNAVGSQTYVIDFNDTSLKLTISAPATFSLQLAGTNTCAGVIGFDNTNTAMQTSFTGTKCVEFYINSILVRISEFSSRLYNRNMVYTFIIPIIENSNQVIQYKDGNSFTQEVKLSGATIASLTISLHHKSGVSIDLNRSEWSCMFEFSD